MKLSEAIRNEYRCNVMFHTQDQKTGAPICLEAHFAIEASFLDTFSDSYVDISWEGPSGDAWCDAGFTKD